MSWEGIYGRGEQLNRFPYTDIVSFWFRHRNDLPTSRPNALDIGCGSGVHSKFMADQGCQVLAIDASATGIKAAQDMFPASTISYQTCAFEEFRPAADQTFDLCVDRLSSTHSSIAITRQLYKILESHLNAGARLFWQGFSWDHDDRQNGEDQGDGRWTGFAEGPFHTIGQVSFFKDDDINDIFSGYTILSQSHTSIKDCQTGVANCFWTLELSYDG